MPLADLSCRALFEWLEASSFGVALRQSTWGFAIVEMSHLLFLAGLGGAVVVVSLRVLAGGRWRIPTARLARDLTPLFTISLVGLIVSGAALVSTEAMQCYNSRSFWVKMTLLAMAILWQFGVHRRVLRSTDGESSSIGARLAVLGSMTLWLGVGVAGRAIGFLG